MTVGYKEEEKEGRKKGGGEEGRRQEEEIENMDETHHTGRALLPHPQEALLTMLPPAWRV